MKTFTPFAVGLLSLLSSQVNAQIDLDEFLEVKEDPLLDNNWPRRYETEFDAIREGATLNNSEGGYWLDGVYATLENQLGDLDFEVEIVLHNPPQENEYVYLVWMQIVDPSMSNSVQKVYEGYSAAIRYKQEVLNELNLANVYQLGYRGTAELTWALGNHEGMNKNDQTDDYPWQFDFKNSDVVRDDVAEDYHEKFVIYRDFTTTHSQIPLKAGGSISLNMGYKIYLSVGYEFANKEGFVEDLEWIMIESSAMSGLVMGLGACVLGLLSF